MRVQPPKTGKHRVRIGDEAAVAIPDPTAWANNLMQVADTRRRWRQQAKDAEAAADAQLWDEVNGLTDAMNAYVDGYRQLVGELQDFRPDWPPKQRRRAAAHYRAWVDPRKISELIHGHLNVLQAVRANSTGADAESGRLLDQLIDTATEFLNRTVYPLLRVKEEDERRARVIDALSGARTAEQAEPVSEWVDETRTYLSYGQAPLAAAATEKTALKTCLTALNLFTALPAALPLQAKPSWRRRLVGLFTRRG